MSSPDCFASAYGAGLSVSKRALIPPPKPAAPRLEPLDSQQIRVTWAPVVCEPPVSHYGIRFRNKGEASLELFDSDTGALVDSVRCTVRAETTECIISDLERNVFYEAALVAKNEAGWSSDSSVSQAVSLDTPSTTWSPPPKPAAPLLEPVDSQQIRVTWDPVVCEPLVSHYGIRFRKKGEAAWKHFDSDTDALVDSGGHSVRAETTECIIGDLESNVFYEAILVANNEAGWSCDSSVSQAVSLETPSPLAAPTVVTAESGSIRVTWISHQCRPPVLHYAIQVRFAGVDDWKLYDSSSRTLVDSGGQAVPANLNEITVAGLRGRYEIRMNASNSVGWSANSASSVIDVHLLRYHSLLHSHPEPCFQKDVVDLAVALGKHRLYSVLSYPGTSLQQSIGSMERLAAEAHMDDVVLYGFSGHGSMRGGRFALSFQDGTLDAEELASKLETIPSRKMLVIIHSCYAGKFPVLNKDEANGEAAAHDELQVADSFARMLNGRSGKVVLMAGGEITYGNLFWEAVTAEVSDAIDRDQTLFCFELCSRVAKAVQAWNDRPGNLEKGFHPQISALGASDFPLVLGKRYTL